MQNSDKYKTKTYISTADEYFCIFTAESAVIYRQEIANKVAFYRYKNAVTKEKEIHTHVLIGHWPNVF